MPWHDVTTGLFVDWAAADPLAHIDPYLVWAAATDFADYGGPPAGPVPALVELTPGHTGQDLQAAGAPEVSVPPAHAGARVCSVAIGPGFLPRLRTNPALGAMVARVELALPVASTRAAVATGAAAPPPPRKPSLPKGGRTVLGVIDDGCAFAHRSLRRYAAGGWSTRVAWLWDQNDARPAFAVAGSTPADFGFGQEYTNAVLQGWMDAATRGGTIDEDACYAAAGYRTLRRRATHGMHVLDIATGPVRPAARLDAVQRPAATTPPVAPDVIFVQLPQAALDDPSGGWLAAHVTDGVRYILERAPADAARIVVNLSYGSRVGPHDGTSTLEAALLEMLDHDPRLEIVLPAGNFFADRAHAVLEVPGGPGVAAIESFLPPGSELPVFVELWLPAEAPPVSVSLTPPAQPQQASGFLGAGTARVWPAPAQPVCTVVYPRRSTLAAQGTCILLAFAPTAPRDGRRPAAPAGRWTIELQAPETTTVHGYIARSDADFGMARRGGRPFFVPDAHYDPRRHLRSAPDDLDTLMLGPPSNVKRRGTLAWAAVHAPAGSAAPRLHLVGGHVARTLGPLPTALDVPAPYASAGPARAAATAVPRPGPDLSLPSDGSPVQRGLRAAGTRSASTVTLVGTSSAAPQLARLRVEGGNTAPKSPPQDPGRFGRGRVDPP